MYTGLKVTAKVKPEYLSTIYRLHNGDKLPKRSDNYWLDSINDSDRNEFIRIWATKFDRSNFIPFGAVCYLDSPWTEGYTKFDKTTRIWEFECSLKNYNSEIQYFLKHVLSELVEDLYVCDYQYEESEFPTRYKLEDLKNV